MIKAVWPEAEYSDRMTVDEFVERKVQPELRPVVAEIRSLMKKHAPDAREAISYGIPMYAMSKPLAWVSPGKTAISLGFRKGAYFDDKYRLLRGAGKHAKNVKMRDLGEVNRSALTYYIKQALKLDRLT